MPEPYATTSETELRAVVERALSTSYELEAEIGRGGMGIVYRARDRRLKRHVAVKVLPPELAFRKEIRSRFLREAETAAQLTHPHIVPIYAVDEADGLVYFVMACIDGDNLGKRIHDRGPMPVEDARRILAEVADALAYAHARGVVHRDIKPDNILLCRDDEDRAMVTDFGIARAIVEGADSRLTATGMAIGTPAFMSPEQSAGDREIDGRSDLYSLGVVAYQMLTGELPFQATSTPAMLVKHLSERPRPVPERRPDCPPDLAAIVMRLLEKEPANRFASAQELEAVLLGQQAIPAHSYHTTQPPLPQAAMGSAMGATMAPLPPSQAPIPPMPTAGMTGAAPAPSAGGARPAAPPATEPPRGFSAQGQWGSLDVAWGRPQPPVPAGERAPRGASSDADSYIDYIPTDEEELRWESVPVRDFRRKLGWFAIVGAVLFVMSVFGNADFFTFLGIWLVYIAYKYAKLWSNGFDWRDVLRQPRERLFADVVAEAGEEVQAFFDPAKRERLRERARRRKLAAEARRPALGAGGGGGRAPLAGYPAAQPAPYGSSAALPAGDAGPHADAVRQAYADRDEILRLLGTMPQADRANIPDVAPSAHALAEKVRALAVLAADPSVGDPGEAARVEQEIAQLEGEANPLDRERSEQRVRRLALLKRQRRALGESSRRRDAAAGKLENCRLALQNMRLDLVRLRTGTGGSAMQVTSVAERALALAREVDHLVGAAEEVRGAVGAPARVPQRT